MSPAETADRSRAATGGAYAIDPDVCVRCGASAGVAPGLVRLGGRSAVVVRQPGTPEEVALLDQAAALCPVGAVRAPRGSGR